MRACSMARPAACSSASRASSSTRSAARAGAPGSAGFRARRAFRAAAALRRPRPWRARCASSARFVSACVAGHSTPCESAEEHELRYLAVPVQTAPVLEQLGPAYQDGMHFKTLKYSAGSS